MNQSFNEAVVPQLAKSDPEWGHGRGTRSDGKDTNSSVAPTRKFTPSAKQLIIYFSRSGSTELLAQKIAQATGADILEIVVKEPYAGDYFKTLARANQERESQSWPELNMEMPDLTQYTTVYLGYPIWAMTLAHPMTAFLTAYGSRLADKTIAPFMSQGGYGAGESIDQIRHMVGGQTTHFTTPLIVAGNRVDRADRQITKWLQNIS
ncbi:flavodoxin family protein [Lacticaseibacillus sp. N501-2]|uniref:flavodoxin family protein n=1 Tax=Lacticaseibacillus salsurae TaxID=3367729 RepID=UPI0038B32B75